MSDVGSDHLLRATKDSTPAPDMYPDDSRFLVTLEGLAISEGFVLPDPDVLIGLGTAAVVTTAATLYIRHIRRRDGRRMRFGVLWNGYRKPLCVKCNGPLRVLNDFSFQCPSCRVELGATGDNGRTISPQEALDRVRLKEYWSAN